MTPNPVPPERPASRTPAVGIDVGVLLAAALWLVKANVVLLLLP